VTFRLRDGDEYDNQRWLERINASRRVHLSSTRIGGRYTLRLCVLSHRTHHDRLEEAVELIRASVPG
jgi:aromatic-L-amino-acid decarboxylase